MPQTLWISLILLLPLAGFVIPFLIGKRFPAAIAGFLGVLLMAISAVLSLILAYSYFFVAGKENGVYQKLIAFKYQWLVFSPGLSIDMGALLDPISVMMLVVITVISLMVHMYSLGYMKGEERISAYFSYLALFTFSMLGLVVSTNIFQMYIFWELVGLSSFLLIGFHFEKISARAAARKAFIVTRFADLGFLIGILALAYYSETLDFQTMIARLTETGSPYLKAATTATFIGVPALTVSLLLVFVGGAGKSAMFPLHIWLPDAMEGPTPVSALIHAATMVVAGVFLVARMFPVFALSAPEALMVVEYIGLFSALFAATIACTQTDIKRVLAYSTMSQIGFMMFALGVSGYGGEQGLGYTASLFHLFTHAAFKALLFLGAGAIIHHVHSNELSEMGGLRKQMPITHLTFLLACMAIAGLPPFAGFFSKEEILLATYHKDTFAFYTALIISGLTAFYMFRLYFSIFWNKSKAPSAHHHGEGPWTMMIPLILLAVATVFLGWIPFGKFVSSDGLALHTSLHLLFSIAPVAIALSGILLAARMYKTSNTLPSVMSQRWGVFYKSAMHRFYIDELYLFITRKFLFGVLARSANWFDRNVVDGLVVRTGDATVALAQKIKAWQSGKIQQYVILFIVAVVLIIITLMLV